MQLPGLVMYDVEKVLLSASPTKANGDPDVNVAINWASSDPEAVGVEPVLDANNQATSCWALTPRDRGTATLSCSAEGYTTDKIVVLRRANRSCRVRIPARRDRNCCSRC